VLLDRREIRRVLVLLVYDLATTTTLSGISNSVNDMTFFFPMAFWPDVRCICCDVN
jgi:hypothetical protein